MLKARVSLCPLQKHTCSAMVLPHVAMGVCRDGSSICLTTDHVIHHVRVHSTKEQIGCMKHKCVLGAFLEGKNSSKYIGKRPDEELSLLNELLFSWHCRPEPGTASFRHMPKFALAWIIVVHFITFDDSLENLCAYKTSVI